MQKSTKECCMNDLNATWEVMGYVLFLYLSPQEFSSFRDGRRRLQVITVFTPQLVHLVTLTASQGSDEVYWSELKVAVGVCGRVLDLSVCLRGKKPSHWGSRSQGVDTSTAGHGRVSGVQDRCRRCVLSKSAELYFLILWIHYVVSAEWLF